ncbi:hypothetical protein CLV98_10185 [Dyadobacter jejuensis]|uniref:Uncharacterized protein n=1 Tax=Dyadobacter jejuensis TaxID=1082580 RepID=A0A316AR52_9BACT|nr:hypothetical protein CLV98_10185 [Dyadobacter jejuensis]
MKSFLNIVLGVVIYVVLSIIASPFLSFNFGAKPNRFEEVIGFFIKHPFGFFFINMSSIIGMILMLLSNGIFWSTLVVKGIPIIKKLIQK